jgi:AcrR family transcriptional regulator
MGKARNSCLWAEVGYELFAEEGTAGIQVERLARILQLNKSGFYHYFGDLEVFTAELLSLHEKKANAFLDDIREVKSIDPEYLDVVVKHKISTMFHLQLIRDKSNPAFAELAKKIDQEEDTILCEVWTDFIGFHDNPGLAIRYFNIVRDIAYTRMSNQTINYTFLHNLVNEAKELVQQIVRQSSLEMDDSLH